MKRKHNPFPGVSRVTDRHGRVRFRFRRKGFDTYLPGSYASAEFRAAYEAAVTGAKTPIRSKAALGTFGWLIEFYLASGRFKDLSEQARRVFRHELDWIRREIGDLPFARFGVRHVEALMSKKEGPAAANRVKKNLSILFNFAIKHEMGITANPARHAERRKQNPDGYHTWTDAEILRFLDVHGPGTQARLCLLLALNTGMARQDLCRAGWQDVTGWGGPEPRIAYRRGKTGQGADLPILPELAEELAQLPRDRMLFLTHGARGLPYKPETLGNWWQDRRREAGVPGSLHGLRKAGATRLANAGAGEREIMAFLAHATPKEGATYTKKADRARLADSGLAKLQDANPGRKLSTLRPKLDKGDAK
ncbi:Mobile element protein [Rubellimicrobium mesophilum DSM 19309]|uniref:Mobile element protein n=1 Tax=Rubellimicrobium mesophilum DSM 19309 TaxID=442562 RepID=A0A017HQW4_9RHOB|nr:tyrosine-type recombinase/integrase [Rubellimicrobium mesophilum]EYD76776.1 Mobile element protein [Rubellimicrobium mesophilum DSM 19309]